MKTYRVTIAEEAFSQIDTAFRYIYEQSPQNADKWINELYNTVYSLTTMPERCGVTRENQSFSQELRCLRHHSHRILYTVDHELSVVKVHAVLHGRKDDLTGDEF